MAVIETCDLHKNYGSVIALRGVSLSVEKGEIYGLLGQNGAGKTTLVKILLGITRKWQGEARLLGAAAGVAHVRKHVGYLPEDHRFPSYHTANSLLHFYGRLLGVSANDRRRKIPEILEEVGLTERQHSKIRTYSKGMKQRLGIAQALFHDPKVIFLDEPTDGVDPLGRREIRGMMQRLRDQGRTLFLNSHLLGEVELICNRIGILRKGEMIREGDVETLTRQRGFFVIGLAPGQTLPQEELLRQGYRITQRGELWEVELFDGQNIDAVVDLLRDRGLSLRHLVEKRQSLEDLFLKVVGDEKVPVLQSADRPNRNRPRRKEIS